MLNFYYATLVVWMLTLKKPMNVCGSQEAFPFSSPELFGQKVPFAIFVILGIRATANMTWHQVACFIFHYYKSEKSSTHSQLVTYHHFLKRSLHQFSVHRITLSHQILTQRECHHNASCPSVAVSDPTTAPIEDDNNSAGLWTSDTNCKEEDRHRFVGFQP